MMMMKTAVLTFLLCLFLALTTAAAAGASVDQALTEGEAFEGRLLEDGDDDAALRYFEDADEDDEARGGNKESLREAEEDEEDEDDRAVSSRRVTIRTRVVYKHCSRRVLMQYFNHKANTVVTYARPVCCFRICREWLVGSKVVRRHCWFRCRYYPIVSWVRSLGSQKRMMVTEEKEEA